MKFYDFPQGSPEWLQCRAGKITASRFKDARDRLKPTKSETIGKPSAKCTSYAAQVAVERIAGRPLEMKFQSWQMKEGSEQEPHARNAYDIETGNVVQEVGSIATDDDLFLYSPDGLVGSDGLLEIKTLLSPDVICRVLGENDLSEYMDQCLGGLWLTGRQWIDLVLWAPALASIGRDLTIKRITRNEDVIEALEADLMNFARMVQDAEIKLRGDRKAVSLLVGELEAEAA
jgi:exodeoxyribonuclease (lambda-induced)